MCVCVMALFVYSWVCVCVSFCMLLVPSTAMSLPPFVSFVVKYLLCVYSSLFRPLLSSFVRCSSVCLKHRWVRHRFFSFVQLC